LFASVTALVLGKIVAAKPTKIIAGHEADKTNELLQALAEAANKKVCRICNTYFMIKYSVASSVVVFSENRFAKCDPTKSVALLL